VNPATVVVDGPADVLDTIMFVQTEPVDIQNADGTVQKRVSMTGLPAGVTVIEPSSGEVDVVVPITQIGVRQDLPGQRVQGINLGQGLGATIQPTEITVTVIGPDAALSSLGAGDISAQVDLAGLGPGTYTLEPQVRVPQGVTWVASNPTSVTVTISNVTGTGNETSPEVTGSPVAIPPEASAEATAPGP
jgi:YbbR domain-containing protein